MASELIDAFALLGQPRRPWLDPDVVKEAFHRLSVDSHPDTSKTSAIRVDFTALNLAYTTLVNPKSRLRHLLALEFPDFALDEQKTPDALGDLFLEIAEELGAVASFLKRKELATTPIAQALLAPEHLARLNRLKTLTARVERHYAEAVTAVKALDQAWDPSRVGSASELAALFQAVSYPSRWLEQARAALLRLET